MEKELEETKVVNELLVKQQANIISQLRQITTIQGEIAQQVVKQHEEIESLYKALGLKKDLSHYSYNIMNAEEH